MNTGRASGFLAVWMVFCVIACSDTKTPAQKAEPTTTVAAEAACGNNIREESETCDGTDVGLETCATRGFDTGSLACNDTCTGFDSTQCVTNPDPECGNNIQEGDEVCDGSDLSGQSCALMGFGSGALGCNDACTGFDTASCSMDPPSCGNNVIDGTEVCDGTDLGGNTCEALSLGTGTLACKEDCTALETSSCSATGSTNCAGPTSYTQGGLNTDLPDGEPCNFDIDCLSGECNRTFYCGDDDAIGAIHVGDLPLGAACDTSTSCTSGYCWAGGDTWVCAEACAEGIDPALAQPGLNCTAIPVDSTSVPDTGAACIPKGAGYIGDSCRTGAYDCRETGCQNSEFCSRVCDPTDDQSCVDGGTVPTSCLLFNSNPFSGDTYICVPDAVANIVTEGGSCEFPYECGPDMICLDEACRKPCGSDSDCPDDSFCAQDNFNEGVCKTNDSRLPVGEACELTSECVANAVCYDAGEGGMCRLLCPNGAADCSAGGLAASCPELATGQALDTVLNAFDSVDAAGAIGGDDDSGEGYFSKLEVELEAGTKDYFVEVSRYPNSPTGNYSLTLSLNGVLSGNAVAEAETTANDTRETAMVVTIGDRIDAVFENVGEAEDVDVFKVTISAQAGDKLIVETGKAVAGICYEVPAELLADGEACTIDDACENSCFPFVREGNGFCATPCSSSDDCNGDECVVFADNGADDGYCFPAGAIDAGTKLFGEACNSPHECGSRICTKHPVEETYRCGSGCEQADEACESDAGRCLAPDPIYASACVPHLNGAVLAGGGCQWAADCAAGNTCAEGQCQPEDISSTRYDPTPVANGYPCNSDSDCVSGTCNENYVCGAGEESPCEGCLSNGQPCNADTQCEGGVCFAGDQSTFFCVDSCLDEEATCTGEVFRITDLSCVADLRGTFGCAPATGVGAPADPCQSGYLDCESGNCWNNAFCIAECSLEGSECGRDAECVTYEAETETERQLDTEMALLDAQGNILVENDDIMYGTYVASWYSSLSYTNEGDATTYVWLRVQSALDAAVATGSYQLQAYTTDNPPPFGSPIVESELRANAVGNDTMVLAHDLTAAGFPVRVMGELPEGVRDVDYFRVELSAGQTLTLTTAEPLGFVCWPSEEVGVEMGDDCRFDFECATGVCLGTCALECTGGNECDAGFECNSFTEDSRSYCFKSLKFGESCEGSAQSSAVPWEYPACPNDACFVRGEGEPQWCSDSCETEEAGSACGALEGENYTGECFEREDGFFCVPHLEGVVAAGDACLLNQDCDTGCCDTLAAQCGTNNCYGE